MNIILGQDDAVLFKIFDKLPFHALTRFSLVSKVAHEKIGLYYASKQVLQRSDLEGRPFSVMPIFNSVAAVCKQAEQYLLQCEARLRPSFRGDSVRFFSEALKEWIAENQKAVSDISKLRITISTKKSPLFFDLLSYFTNLQELTIEAAGPVIVVLPTMRSVKDLNVSNAKIISAPFQEKHYDPSEQ